MYPNRAKAEEAFRSFLRHYLGDSDSGKAVRLENGKWCATAVQGSLLAVVLEADSRELADSLLSDM
jgi:hypothetical protein